MLVLGLGFFPVIWSFLLSTKSTNGFGPEHSVGLANYRELAHDPEWLAPVSRSLKFTLLYVPVTVLMGLGLALLLNQKIRFIGFYRTCFFVPFVASAAATGVIFLYVLDPQYGVVDNAIAWMGFRRQQFLDDPDWALFLLAPIYTWTAVGFDILIYLAALQDVPQDQSEAARIDGAGRFARLLARDPARRAPDHRAGRRLGDDQRAAVLRHRLGDQARRADRRDHGDHRLRLQARLRARASRASARPSPACSSSRIVVLVLMQVGYARWRKLDVV